MKKILNLFIIILLVNILFISPVKADDTLLNQNDIDMDTLMEQISEINEKTEELKENIKKTKEQFDKIDEFDYFTKDEEKNVIHYDFEGALYTIIMFITILYLYRYLNYKKYKHKLVLIITLSIVATIVGFIIYGSEKYSTTFGYFVVMPGFLCFFTYILGKALLLEYDRRRK